MIKGVNKKIVEINYTKNDYIEKAILIINPSKSNSPDFLINKKVDDYMKTLIPLQEAKKKKDKGTALLFTVLISILLLLILAVIIAII